VYNRLSCNQAPFHRMSILVESSPPHWQARQAGGHWFEPSTAHLTKAPLGGVFCRLGITRSWSSRAEQRVTKFDDKTKLESAPVGRGLR
jgi:hypothetical protein